MSSGLAHAQHFNQSIYYIILEECEGIPGFYPWGTVLFFKYSAKLFCLPLFINKLFHLRALQILTIKTQIVIKHLREYTQNSSFILIDGSLDIYVKQDRVGFSADRACDLHESRLIIKLLTEIILDLLSIHFLVFQEV